MSTRRKKTEEERRLESEAAKIWGKQVSREKGIALLIVALIACALPSLLGLRLWDQIPEIVQSGLIGLDGEDDAMPRWVVCIGLPGLMCVLNMITHGQLLFNQKRGTMPPKPSRILGRWGFPILSVIFCSGFILEKSGRPALPATFVTPCAIGLTLMLLGGHMLDCPRDSRIALNLAACSGDREWKAVHTFAGYLWLAAGIVLIACAMLGATSFFVVAPLAALSLAAPFAYASLRFGKSSENGAQ